MDDFIKLELEKYNIKVLEYDFESSRFSFCTKYQDQWYICINSAAGLTKMERNYVLEHEIEHIRTGLVYNENTPQIFINKIESIIERNTYLKTKYIQKDLPDTEEVADTKKRMDLKIMKNCVALLCLRDNISIEELSLKIGRSRSYTEGILKQQEIIELEVLKRLCDIFDETPEYICCQQL